MTVRNAVAVLLTAAASLPLAACGDDDNGTPRLTVSAASSLTTAFSEYVDGFDDADVRLSFAGSDQLAAQIRAGGKPDIFAAANTKLPDALNKEKLVDKPVVFAANRLVLAVSEDSEIDGLTDLARSGTTIAMGSASVPIGEYARKVLGGLSKEQSEAILGNVRSDEPDVAGVVGKLTQGAVDAGFVYVTDAEAAKDDLKAIELPADLQPVVAYGIAVVSGSEHAEEARAFIDGLLDGDGAAALKAAGFAPPP